MAKHSVNFLDTFIGYVSTHPLDWFESLALDDVDALLAEPDEERRRALFAASEARSRRRLARVLGEPVAREALFLTRPILFAKLDAYLEHAREGRVADEDKPIERSIVGHLASACASVVPKNLLSAAVAARADEKLSEPARVRCLGDGLAVRKRRTLANPAFMRRLAAHLTSADPIRWWVKPRPNPTWHIDPQEPDSVIFRRIGEDGAAALCRLARSPMIEAFLEEAEPRSRTARQLLARVAARFPTLTLAQAEEFYGRLCRAGALIGHFEIPFEEPDGLPLLIRWLGRLPASARPAAALRDLRKARLELGALDRVSGGSAQSRLRRYDAAMELLARHSADTPERMAGQHNWVVESLSAWSVTVGRPVLDELRATLGEMTRIFDSERHRHFMIQPLYDALRRRFPDRSRVALTDVYRLEPEHASKEELLLGPAAYGELLDRLLALQRDAAGATLPLTPERLASIRMSGAGRSPWGAGRIVLRLANGARAFPLVLDMAFASATKDLTSVRMQSALGARAAAAVRAHYAWLRRKLGRVELVHGLYRLPDAATYDSWHARLHRRGVEIDGPPSGSRARALRSRDVEVLIDDEKRSLALRLRASGAALHPTYDGLSPSRGELDPCAQLVHDLSLIHTPSLSYLFALPLGLGKVRRSPPITLGRSRLTAESRIVAARELAPESRQDACFEFTRLERWRRERGLPRFVFVYPRGGSRLTAQFVDFWNPFSAPLLRAKAKAWGPDAEIILEDSALDETAFRSASGLRFVHELRLGFHWDDD